MSLCVPAAAARKGHPPTGHATERRGKTEKKSSQGGRNLESEIERCAALGVPLLRHIFQNTAEAVLTSRQQRITGCTLHAMMGGEAAKTAFGFTKKSAKKKDVGVNEKADEGARKEYLSGVNGTGLEFEEKPAEAQVKAIPVQENTFEVGTGRRRKAPSFLPDESAVEEDKERFEVAERISAGGETAQHGVTYGLTKMGPKDGEGQPVHKAEPKPEPGVARINRLFCWGGGWGEAGSSSLAPKHDLLSREEYRVELLFFSLFSPLVIEPLNVMKPKSEGEVSMLPMGETIPRAGESFIGKSLQEKELQAFKEDLEDLPEQSTLDDYTAMPIEDFGAAMLRGMGWEEGKPVGRNSKGLVAAVEFVPRGGRLGLGADAPVKEQPKKKYIKPGESREKPPEMVLAEGPEGKSRNVKSLDEKLVVREVPGAREGKTMCVVEGRHRGLLGRVLKLMQQEGRSERAHLELASSGEVVVIRCSELADLGTREADAAQGKGKDRNPRDDDAGGKKRQRDKDEQRSVDGESKHKKKERRTEREEPKPWLHANTRVRIVSKSFEGGRLYLKKAVVVDVLTPRECVLELEGGEVLSNVSQRVLETALPKRGGRVMILQGPYRGQRGKMLDKKGEAASVQLNEDFSLHNFTLDAIAEYTGEEYD